MPEGLAAGSTPKLEISDLSISYVDRAGVRVQAVDGVNLNVANKPGAGELAVFLGPSGCGKSTILKAVAGLLEQDKGKILIDGVEVSGTGRDRGMVFQSYTSFGWRSVVENVEYGLELRDDAIALNYDAFRAEVGRKAVVALKTGSVTGVIRAADSESASIEVAGKPP